MMVDLRDAFSICDHWVWWADLTEGGASRIVIMSPAVVNRLDYCYGCSFQTTWRLARNHIAISSVQREDLNVLRNVISNRPLRGIPIGYVQLRRKSPPSERLESLLQRVRVEDL
jgi:hypothetical protein